MSVKKLKIFVTGASGKIGRKLIPELIKRGYKVVALVRDRSKVVEFGKNIEIVEADLSEIDKYRNIMLKCDYVFHLAAYQNMFDRKIDKFEKVNIEGTKILLNAIRESMVKKFLYVSTIMTLGKVDMKNFYVNTKFRALKLVKKSKVPWVILYPSIVIDLEDKSGGCLWNFLTGGIPGGLMMRAGDKNRIIKYIWIDKLVKLMADAVDGGKVGHDIFLFGESITAENYLKKMFELKGKKYLPWRIPFI